MHNHNPFFFEVESHNLSKTFEVAEWSTSEEKQAWHAEAAFSDFNTNVQAR